MHYVSEAVLKLRFNCLFTQNKGIVMIWGYLRNKSWKSQCVLSFNMGIQSQAGDEE